MTRNPPVCLQQLSGALDREGLLQAFQQRIGCRTVDVLQLRVDVNECGFGLVRVGKLPDLLQTATIVAAHRIGQPTGYLRQFGVQTALNSDSRAKHASYDCLQPYGAKCTKALRPRTTRVPQGVVR